MQIKNKVDSATNTSTLDERITSTPMTVFYDASQSQSIPLPDGSVDLTPKPQKTYEILTDGEKIGRASCRERVSSPV